MVTDAALDRVELSNGEVLSAAQVGIMRHYASLKSGKPDAFGKAAEGGWTEHVEGALGELAVSKYLGIHWPATINTYRSQPDTGPYEVRTRSRHDYDLIIRESDRDDAIYILVTGICPIYCVRGWMVASEGKQPEFLQSYGHRPPAYFLPAARLYPMATLSRNRSDSPGAAAAASGPAVSAAGGGPAPSGAPGRP